MGGKYLPLLFLLLGAGLWSLVFVDRCIGDDGSMDVVREVAAAAEDSDMASMMVASVDSVPTVKTAVPTRQGCIDVNHADASELDALPGVGPAIAGRIIDFRNRNGSFATLSDLDAVKGIGPAMLRKLEGRVCF